MAKEEKETQTQTTQTQPKKSSSMPVAYVRELEKILQAKGIGLPKKEDFRSLGNIYKVVKTKLAEIGKPELHAAAILKSFIEAPQETQKQVLKSLKL